MKYVLHITNDFNFTKVHKNLFSELQNINIEQFVYIPLKNIKNKGQNHFTDNAIFSYSAKLKKLHRYFFRAKINYLYNDIFKKIELKDVKVIHASTLYSDGFLAHKIFKRHNVPYIVTVRNTDIYTFYKYRKDLICGVNEVLDNASKIIFISNANYNSFLNLKHINHSKYKTKYIVVNNGIDDFWIDNRNEYTVSNENTINCLFIGRFDKNKNVLNLIKALSLIRYKGLDIRLTLVGGRGDKQDIVLDVIRNNRWIDYKGYIEDKEELLKIFRSNDFFTMVSHHETFGLVYLEALSQGVPVLYTKSQGFDGYTNLHVGESSNSKNAIEIEKSLKKLFSNCYNDINSLNFEKLRWRNIAYKYKEIYEKV